MIRAVLILLTFLLPSCEEKQECDVICEIRKADFERLTTHVFFENMGGYGILLFSAHKTATGAIANYKPPQERERLEAELSPEEWINFIKDLYKCLDKDLNEWEGKDEDCHSTFRCARKLSIYHLDSNQTDGYNYWKTKLTDWNKVEKTIDNILSIIRKRSEISIDAKLKAEYQKKFGEPITDIELSTNRIKFWLSYFSTIIVTRTETGALLEYSTNSNEDIPDIEIDIGEWLDFVRSLYKIDINKWRKKYGELNVTKAIGEWRLEIYYSDKAGFSLTEGYDAYPPNWDEFMKVMDGMEAKAKKKHPNW